MFLDIFSDFDDFFQVKLLPLTSILAGLVRWNMLFEDLGQTGSELILKLVNFLSTPVETK